MLSRATRTSISVHTNGKRYILSERKKRWGGGEEGAWGLGCSLHAEEANAPWENERALAMEMDHQTVKLVLTAVVGGNEE